MVFSTKKHKNLQVQQAARRHVGPLKDSGQASGEDFVNDDGG
jgi:hypothetical protein